MSEQSVQSVSKPRGTQRVISNHASKQRNHQDNNLESGNIGSDGNKLSMLLTKSLAVSLVKVRDGCGSETAKGIIEILQDESFDLTLFRKNVSSIHICDEICGSIIKSNIN